MPLCLIVSAYCGSYSSLTNVSQIFKYCNILIKRCGKTGNGDILLLFQDIHGKWTKYDWTNFINNNGRKLINGYISQQQNICLQQLQKQTSSSMSQSPTIEHHTEYSMIKQLINCINECKQHSLSVSGKQSKSIYNIVIIGNESCLSFNESDIYLNSFKSNNKLSQILSLSRIIPLNINMICLCSPLKNYKKFRDYNFINNCCSICNQQFFRLKPNKKQHFPKMCHQVALKQIKIQKCFANCKSFRNSTDSIQPQQKKRRLMTKDNDDGTDSYDLSEILISSSVLFWQNLIDSSHGIFRWMFMDFNQSNIDLVFQSIANKISSQLKLRYLSIGSLIGQCSIFPGPNNNYFTPPNNKNNKIIKFENQYNDKQLRFEINQQIQRLPTKFNNSFIKAIHSNISINTKNNTEYNIVPLNILHENNVNITMGCDVISILGFLDRKDEWLPIPVISRHFLLPFINNITSSKSMDNNDSSMNIDQDKSSTGKGADITIFVKELLLNHNKIGLVTLNPSSKPSWYGFIHADNQSNGKYLLLDILSPYINVEQLYRIQSQSKPTPQYTLPHQQINNNNNNNKPSMLNVYDSVSAYFPTESNIIKEFDKFIRLLKQKKILECFEIAEVIRKRAHMFHIQQLIKQLIDIINRELNETKSIIFELPKENQIKHQFDIMLKLLNDSLRDKRVKIVWNPSSNSSSNKNRHHSHSHSHSHHHKPHHRNSHHK